MSHSGFCFPVPDIIENERVKLVAFDAARHAAFMCDQPAHVFDYLTCGPFTNATHFEEEFWKPYALANAEEFTAFAIFDRTRSTSEDATSFAGMVSYINASATDLCAEIGWIVVLPAFQRTHVTTNMVGLLAQYAMNIGDGLGLRRLVWQCASTNGPSQNTAKRMGFQYEGTLRWHRRWPADKAIGSNGRKVKEGDPKGEWLGRDTIILSITFEDWESGTRDLVAQRMERRT